MGHHGWQGDPPRSEDQARRRIVDAAITCIDRNGLAKTSFSDVALEVGITRQTVYRYFPSLADVLTAVAQAGADEFAERMQRHLAKFDNATDAAAESVVFAVRTIPDEPYMGLLLQAGGNQVLTARSTSSLEMFPRARNLGNHPSG